MDGPTLFRYTSSAIACLCSVISLFIWLYVISNGKFSIARLLKRPTLLAQGAIGVSMCVATLFMFLCNVFHFRFKQDSSRPLILPIIAIASVLAVFSEYITFWDLKSQRCHLSRTLPLLSYLGPLSKYLRKSIPLLHIRLDMYR
ncbi:hypothetical protein K432DRAFT_224098 [Lepidopterella palustris CBS 459.81]|uniref:Uncharacterized protein n=1 Tax=Lepidopterella palustris CBS 459.81 TaxID=1314670 RepID=A0A8E2DY41_9PEZI|nr:hypothetical protein K432DRAFT_224098 [Lepidopterella palustris CBS 459.81]